MTERRSILVIGEKHHYNRDATVYPQIEDSEVRINMRVGDIMMSAALSDPVFRRELARKKIRPVDFSADNGEDLFPALAVKKIQEVGGQETTVRVLGTALRNVDSFETLNGDKEAVRFKLAEMLIAYDDNTGPGFSPAEYSLDMIEQIAKNQK